MQSFIIEKSEEEFYTPHSGLVLVGLAINKYTSMATKLSRLEPNKKGISNADVIRNYLGLMSLGKSDYEAIADKKGDSLFQSSLGIKSIPSPETLRQRLDNRAVAFEPIISSCAIEFIKKSKATISPVKSTGHVPLDIDVFPMDNSNTAKEGVSRTYHNYDGYTPIAAYLGMEGWCWALS
ncbi:MAG: hypothetical protein EYX74_04685 [Desulfobulbaceae bacterium]|nr:MAG: hypothetical protein EYX74_04685 [Desulfobulbaceae bacterium]